MKKGDKIDFFGRDEEVRWVGKSKRNGEEIFSLNEYGFTPWKASKFKLR